MGNYYEDDLKIGNSLHNAFEKAIAILDFLEWGYKDNGVDVIIARTSVSAFGWGEKVRISFEDKHHMRVESESVYAFQFFDFGKNESNVDKFLSIFRKAKLPFNASDFADEKPRSFLGRYLSGR